MPGYVRQLRRWQARELSFRAAWGVARWVAVVALGLAACCGIDWFIDQYQDTPRGLRFLLTAGQLIGYAVAAVLLIGKLRSPRMVALATRAEAAIPEFGHRLVTALQLSRPGAKTEGMSPELIAAVAKEADETAGRHDLAKLADTSGGRRAIIVLIPLLLVGVLLAFLAPNLSLTLLARQIMPWKQIDIPRSVTLENETPELWPAGDEVVLRFHVTGRFDETSTGTVRVFPDGQPPESYPLAFDSSRHDGSATFAAKLPASSSPFRFRGRLRDGRTRADASVRFEPRPVVKELSAALILPVYVDPAGMKRYERFQPQAEVTALPGCGLRVEATTSKPTPTATVVVLTRDAAGQENLIRVPMTVDATGLAAAATFDIPPKAFAYRVEVTDANGFANSNPPRRGIALSPDDPPKVNLLSEVFKDPKDPGPLDDYDVSGMPLVVGGQVQVGYAARSPLGLARAFIRYRVNDGDWRPLPLKETIADLAVVGRFVPELGVFENSGPVGKVEFYQLPATDPENEPPGLEGGGRYNFQTTELMKTGPDGKESKLVVGDRVEFYVEVFDRNPAELRPGGKSESRFKTVVTQSQLEDWTRQRDQSQERLRQLEERQRGIFKPGG